MMQDLPITEIQQLLFQEARLLDEQQFEAWLNLYTSDCIYWVPLEKNQLDGIHTSSIIYDDKTLMEIRIRQYAHARAHARNPLPRTVHAVSNIQVEKERDGIYPVFSNLVLAEYRQETQRSWFATVEHHVKFLDKSFKIQNKRINLINSEAELDGISILF
jgi:benzoate/toluate 1,2-dioxygenase beta subunit